LQIQLSREGVGGKFQILNVTGSEEKTGTREINDTGFRVRFLPTPLTAPFHGFPFGSCGRVRVGFEEMGGIFLVLSSYTCRQITV